METPAAGFRDAEFGAVAKLGHAHAKAAITDERRLKYRAGFVHARLGYMPQHYPALRAALLFDFAGTDTDPDVNTNGRFDTLFGARRWEYGPTATYGLIARSNLLSPALKGEWKASERARFMLIWRPAWLAAERDALISTGQRDASGQAGRFIGHQVEVMGQHTVIAKRLELEAGITGLAQGEFLREVSRATDEAQSVYGYVRGTLQF